MKKAYLVMACLVAMPGLAAAARPVTFEDMLAMRRVEAPVISPDGAYVLYAVRQWESPTRDPQRKEARSQVWRVSVADGSTRQLTFDEAGANAPAWSPDGRFISFLSARGSSGEDRRAQIWLMPADGGESRKLTDSKDAVIAYEWSPDSKRIAFVSREPETADEEARRKRGDDRRIFENEFRRSHIWVADVAAGTSDRVTEGPVFGVRGTPSWSPDGARLAVAAAPTTLVRDDRSDIYLVDIASRAADKITTNAGPDTAPRWSPDGRTIAFTSETNRNPEWPDGTRTGTVVNSRLILYDVASHTLKDASSPQFDLLAGDPVWTPDSRRILFTTGKSVYREVFAYEVATGRYEQLTKNQIVTLGGLSRDGSRAALLLESATAAPNVYVSDLAMTSPRRLTTVNPEASEFALGEAEVIRWKSDGVEIEGILQKPVGYAPGTRYPLLVVPHGGPTGAHLNSFRVGFGDGGQHWAGQGWAVLYPNPRGSTNYGERFMTANIDDWGGRDFRDVMTGVDAVVARGIGDPDRLAIEGWSYGGYMTAWAITQTNRFKAAMVGAGIINLVSMYATNDMPNYLAGFFRGVPGAANLSLYLERSPLSHAARATTPTLILHGGNDERVPIGQPMELYRALRDRGVAAELVFYPREGHGLTEYFHQLDRLRRQFDWITKYVERRRPTSQ